MYNIIFIVLTAQFLTYYVRHGPFGKVMLFFVLLDNFEEIEFELTKKYSSEVMKIEALKRIFTCIVKKF